MRTFASAVAAAGMALLAARPAGAQDTAPPPPQTTVSYGDDGLVVKSSDGNFRVQLRWRLQFRASAPFDAELSGRLAEGKLLDSTYFAGVFTGMGANTRSNDDSHL